MPRAFNLLDQTCTRPAFSYLKLAYFVVIQKSGTSQKRSKALIAPEKVLKAKTSKGNIFEKVEKFHFIWETSSSVCFTFCNRLNIFCKTQNSRGKFISHKELFGNFLELETTGTTCYNTGKVFISFQ